MQYSINDYGNHVRALARAFQVTFEESEDQFPCGGKQYNQYGESRWYVRTRPIRSEYEYSIAMHELGHCCHPSGFLQPTPPRFVLEQRGGCIPRNLRVAWEEEAAAWEWAKRYALTWTSEMERAYETGMASYEELRPK